MKKKDTAPKDLIEVMLYIEIQRIMREEPETKQAKLLKEIFG